MNLRNLNRLRDLERAVADIQQHDSDADELRAMWTPEEKHALDRLWGQGIYDTPEAAALASRFRRYLRALRALEVRDEKAGRIHDTDRFVELVNEQRRRLAQRRCADPVLDSGGKCGSGGGFEGNRTGRCDGTDSSG